MRRLRGSIAGGLASLTLAVLTPAGPALADPPMWRVHYGSAEVVLFGSIHLLTPGLQWRSPALDAELARAGVIYFEVPLDQAGGPAAQAAALARSRLPPGHTLSSLLPRKAKAQLAREAKTFGTPLAVLDTYRPWFAELALTLIELRSEGAVQSAGVESTLSHTAPATAERRALETPEQQIAMMADGPQADQVASLEETLRELETDPREFEDLEKAWLAGDVAGIERTGTDPLRKASPGLYRRMVSDRNHRWADQIDALLKSGGHAFIVVGVGHLVGSDGVPDLLRRRGFKVEGP